MTPTGNAGLEYEKLQVLRILDAAANAEASLASACREWQGALSRVFYLADDVGAMVPATSA